MHKPGAILKVSVTNFVTFTYAEMVPGPNLNLLIGPNGSGKSTMVSAIVLGLGGSPKVIGRGQNVSEYVKHNCNSAKIELVLCGNEENETFNIIREFDKLDHSIWKLNDKKVTLKEITRFTKELNVQVDNLCQFLPQDKVADFAKLNKIELLNQTLIALCRTDLTTKQKDLMTQQERRKILTANQDKLKAKLRSLKDDNLRLEGKVCNFRTKKKLVAETEHVDRKIRWVKFESMSEQRDAKKLEIKEASKLLDQQREEFKPIESQINKLKLVTSQLEGGRRNAREQLLNIEQQFKDKRERLRLHKSSISNVTAEKNDRIKQIEEKKKELAQCQIKMDQLNKDKSDLVASIPGDVGKVLQTLSKESQNALTSICNMEEKKQELSQKKREKLYEIRSVENELKNLENIKGQRLEHLRRVDNDAYTATLWIRENAHVFEGQVFEPIMLEVNVVDARYVKYVEASIAVRDKVGFLCTSKEDIKLLVRRLRNERNLRIAIFHIEAEGETYRPNRPIEQLSRYGFKAYVHTLFTAPPPVMRYLCKTNNLHNLPVAFQNTTISFDDLPSDVNRFFRGDYFYSISRSKYTGEKSTQQSGISSDNTFSLIVDQVRVENANGKLQECTRICEDFDRQIVRVDETISQIRTEHGKLKEKMQAIRHSQQNVENIQSRIRMLSAKIEQIETSQESIDVIESDCRKQIEKILTLLVKCIQEEKDVYKRYSEALEKFNLDDFKLEISKNQIEAMENKSENVRRKVMEAEGHLENFKAELSQINQEAKFLLAKAKEVSNGFTPDDRGFEEFRKEYDSLPGNLDFLEKKYNELTAKIECLMIAADDEEMQEYYDREKNIQKIETSIESEGKELEQINNVIENLFNAWMQPLSELVEQINQRFTCYFERMGYSGEISVYTGDDESNYDKYGLSIKVTFRNGHPLQELNNVIQSGGERAVTTAAYMLSLQDLTPVPFRCVDEINQGMDAHNERLVFNLIVSCTDNTDSPQYFLVTPKLLPGLKYPKTMRAHLVINAPFTCTQKEWNRAIIG